MKKMEWNGFKITVLVAGCIIGLISLILAGILLNEYVFIKEKEAELVVEETYFEKEEEVGGKTLLNVFVMVTNDGDKDCDSHVRAFIIDRDTNIAMDDTTTVDERIEGQTTFESGFQLSVPSNARYRVEILVFKDGMITVKGVGHIDLSSGGSSGQDYRTTMEDEVGEAKMDTPFLGPAALLAAVGVTVLIFRRWRK